MLNKVENRVHFYDGDVFKGLPPNMIYDIIVSNPPYIRKKDMEFLMPDVKDYEPENALCGGEDGLDFYRTISAEGRKLLKADGYIFFEIGYDEANGVKEILVENGYKDICVKKDLSGLDRVVTARMED
ncbi:Release factor glutamine methyltransferase [bioreactor metagenome]|uniref:Release factor glutamine methyltransferase n=1 Tax=bioreactor metagenome TaxID=1076179 RepID=A0A645AQT7_9ZZZZ